MATSKDKDEIQEKILKALQDVYKTQDALASQFDKLKESVDINTQALVVLNKWFQHLRDFEKEIFKHWLKDDGKKPPYNPPFGY